MSTYGIKTVEVTEYSWEETVIRMGNLFPSLAEFLPGVLLECEACFPGCPHYVDDDVVSATDTEWPPSLEHWELKFNASSVEITLEARSWNDRCRVLLVERNGNRSVLIEYESPTLNHADYLCAVFPRSTFIVERSPDAGLYPKQGGRYSSFEALSACEVMRAEMTNRVYAQ